MADITRWEYTTGSTSVEVNQFSKSRFQHDEAAAQLAVRFNELGDEGWEAVGEITVFPSSGLSFLTTLFKRPKS